MTRESKTPRGVGPQTPPHLGTNRDKPPRFLASGPGRDGPKRDAGADKVIPNRSRTQRNPENYTRAESGGMGELIKIVFLAVGSNEKRHVCSKKKKAGGNPAQVGSRDERREGGVHMAHHPLWFNQTPQTKKTWEKKMVRGGKVMQMFSRGSRGRKPRHCPKKNHPSRQRTFGLRGGDKKGRQAKFILFLKPKKDERGPVCLRGRGLNRGSTKPLVVPWKKGGLKPFG